MKKWFACFLVFASTGCPDVKTDTDDPTTGPAVEFDPANRIVPFPNNLLLDPVTGKVTLPAQCNESASAKALREGVINQLDGFGTFETAISVTFTEEVDPASLTPETLVVYQRVADGTPVEPADAMQLPVVVLPAPATRFDPACMNPTMVNSATIGPLVPLDQRSTYTVALLSGVKTAGGADFNASFTWSLIRQTENPVTLDDSGNVVADRTPLDPGNPEDLNENGVGDDLESLLGIDRLWKAHAQAIAFLEAKNHQRDNILLAWEFTTQTTTDPLDPAVATSPAAMTPTTPFGVALDITGEAAARATYPYLICDEGTLPLGFPPEANNTQCFLKMAIGGGRACATQETCAEAFNAGSGACASLGCGNVGGIFAGLLGAPQYQVDRPNAFDPTKPIPGPWGDPVAPEKVKDETIQVLMVIPAGTMPAGGWPTVVFQHGLGQSKTNVFGIGPQLARDPDGPGALTSFATVSIDAVAHDSRAIRISDDAARGCAGTPSPVSAPQCFAPFLSPDLGATRDNIRQTMLDQQRLVAALKACGTSPAPSGCGPLQVDANHIVYLGMSLGGIMGSVTTAVTDDIQAAVLNVAGVGWVDILERTQTRQIQCMLVDGLIDAGILMGDKFSPGADPDDPADDTGLCLTEAWKQQPGYRQFSAIGRWVLDPADPANFTRKLAARRFLLQEVVGDTVVPNYATDNEGALVGLMTGTDASCGVPTGTPPSIGPSAAIVTDPMTSKFLKYLTVPPGTASCPPGNTFNHGSLLRPAPSVTGAPCNPSTGASCDGTFATVRVQTDAITYLHLNK